MGLRDEQKQFRATKGAMGLRDKLEAGKMGNTLTPGFYKYTGEDPNKVAGATKAGDIHQDAEKYTDTNATHVGGHTILDIKGEPVKYTDNLPA